MSKEGQGVGESSAKETLPNPADAPYLLEAIGGCIDGGSSHLSQLYKHFRPEHILDQLASYEGFPDELKLLVLEEFVRDHHATIYLRDKKDFDNIIANELSKCRSTTKKTLMPILEEAVLTTSVIRLAMLIQHRTLDAEDYFACIIPEDLLELKTRIRHLELRHYMQMTPEVNITRAPSLLPRVEAGMSLAQREFPGLHGLDVHVYIIMDLLERNLDAAAWLDIPCGYKPDFDTFVHGKIARNLIAQTLNVAKNGASGKRKDVFKLSVYQRAAGSAVRDGLVQTEAADLSTIDDFGEAIGESLATAKDAEIDEPDMAIILEWLNPRRECIVCGVGCQPVVWMLSAPGLRLFDGPSLTRSTTLALWLFVPILTRETIWRRFIVLP